MNRRIFDPVVDGYARKISMNHANANERLRACVPETRADIENKIRFRTERRAQGRVRERIETNRDAQMFARSARRFRQSGTASKFKQRAQKFAGYDELLRTKRKRRLQEPALG